MGRKAWGRSSVSAATSGWEWPRSPYLPLLPPQEIPRSQNAESVSEKHPHFASSPEVATPALQAAGAEDPRGRERASRGGLLPLWGSWGASLPPFRAPGSENQPSSD